MDKDELEMRAKSKGKGIMVSDLVFENFGFLQLTDAEYEAFKL